MHVLRSGYDGLDVAFQINIPPAFEMALEWAQGAARRMKEPCPLSYRGNHMMVSDGGSKGGYAFRCDTGEVGETWFFKRANQGNRDHWGIRVSVKGVTLALYGLDEVENRLFAFLNSLSICTPPMAHSIGRVDYAIDIRAPFFELHHDRFVMHGRTGFSAEYEKPRHQGRAGRTESVTVGKMPGRQLIVYDKRAEVIQKQKSFWFDIWDDAAKQAGLPPVAPTDRNSCQIWRVELRAGKRALKDRWKITTFNDLRALLPGYFRQMMKEIRLTVPTNDSNCSRWDNDPLYDLAKDRIIQNLIPTACGLQPDRVREIMIQDRIYRLRKMSEGCWRRAEELKSSIASSSWNFEEKGFEHRFREDI